MSADRESGEQVRQLLAELDDAQVKTVGPLLLSLQSMADGEPPPPSPELAALLAANGRPTAPPRRAPHRGMVFSLALIGALIAGTGTAAAVSPDFRSGAAQAIANIINAIPFAHPTIESPVPSAPLTSTPSPTSPGKSGGATHPTPVPSKPTHSDGPGNGNSSDHANPRSTNHPTPSPNPPANGHGGAKP